MRLPKMIERLDRPSVVDGWVLVCFSDDGEHVDQIDRGIVSSSGALEAAQAWVQAHGGHVEVRGMRRSQVVSLTVVRDAEVIDL